MEEPHVVCFDQWVKEKKGRPQEEITFVACYLYWYTYGADARRVAFAVELPPTHVRWLAKTVGVLEFDEFGREEDVVLALVSAGASVSLIRPENPAFKPTRPREEWVFMSLEQAQEHFARKRSEERKEDRQESIDRQMEKKGAAQVELPGFE